MNNQLLRIVRVLDQLNTLAALASSRRSMREQDILGALHVLGRELLLLCAPRGEAA